MRNNFWVMPRHNGLRVRVNESGHVWCGPAVLSAAMGITSKEAKQVIKSVSLRKYIKAVTYGEMKHALVSMGVKCKSIRYPRRASDCLSLERWLKHRDENTTYLICITGHWIAVRGNHWVDNTFPDGRRLDACPYNRCKVRYVIQLLAD